MTVISDRAQAAYAAIRKLTGPGLAEPQSPTSQPHGFATAVKEAAKGVRDNLVQAEKVSLDAMVSKADSQSVVEAVAKAELALQTASVVRDRVVQAYQDILRMPV
jgi:flagellar hook-basal body complex protein FliE